MSRDFKKHNFGLRSRQIWKALHFAAKEAVHAGSLSETTVANAKTTFKDFGLHLKDEAIFDLRNVKQSHVHSYADLLRDRVEAGEITWNTATEYLGRVNAALERASGSRSACVTASEMDFPKRDGIAREDRSQEIDHRHAQLSEQHQALLGLCRHLKLRFEESVKFNAVASVGLSIGDSVTIERGTKGGRPRQIEIRCQVELDAIRRAAAIQPGQYTQIPPQSDYKTFKARFYKEIQDTGIRPHALRHRGAQELYLQLAGVPCPIAAGVHHKEHRAFIAQELGVSSHRAREIDIAARMVVAQDLGHGRIEITNAYLG